MLTAGHLFDAKPGLPEWLRFSAAGYGVPVHGVIYDRMSHVRQGMPLGGIGTGCVDLDANGHLGSCSLFGSLTPRRRIAQPFLALAVDGRVSALATSAPAGVGLARDIRYWGHYPIADLEFDLEGPVSAALRSWAPFIVGDVTHSAMPAIVFELHLVNHGGAALPCSAMFSFPGPTMFESRGLRMDKNDVVDVDGITGAFKRAAGFGAFQSREPTSYLVGVLGEDAAKVRTGGPLDDDPRRWAEAATTLPVHESTDFGVSVAVDLELAAGEERVIRFLLTWHVPAWRGSGTAIPMGNEYHNWYTTQYGDALDVARAVAASHHDLLRRVIAWQSVVYTDGSLPGWLQDSLVNILHLITEDSVWAAAGPPLPAWVRPDDGLFAMNESPESCPQLECIPNSFLGNWPLVYFFPELARSTMRGYVGYMSPAGAVPWCFGGMTGGTGGYELIYPTIGYQVTMNGACFVDLVDRLWRVLGDRKVLEEFYPAARAATEFMIGLNTGPDGVISMPDHPVSIAPRGHPQLPETSWLEACEWVGMVAHVGGVHLAMLQMARRMAESIGDTPFAEQCRSWMEAGQQSLEDRLWDGTTYLNYSDPPSGRVSDWVMANQLDGEWMSRFHGLPGVFPADRVQTVLETVRRTNHGQAAFGVVNFATREGVAAGDVATGYGEYNIFPGELMKLAMTYMFAGDRDFGLELVRGVMEAITCRRRLTWQMPNIMDGRTGGLFFGTDYLQPMMLWALPASLDQVSLEQPGVGDGLVARMLAAARR